MISIKASIFYNYIIAEVYCEDRSHPENILFIRRISTVYPQVIRQQGNKIRAQDHTKNETGSFECSTSTPALKPFENKSDLEM